jgi:hypothetical protein
MLAIALLVAPRPAFAETNFYETDFEHGVDPAWSRSELVTRPSGSFLGNFGPEAASLSLDALPAHARLAVEFDLYVIATWDGNLESYGPDLFRVDVDGTNVLQTTFSNVPGTPQSYPDPYPGGDHEAFTGSEALVPDIFNAEVARYRIRLVVAHAAPSLQVTFAASGLQELTDESWGIDRVRIALDLDEDRDGLIDDAESPLCLGSPADAVTTSVGCDVDQACPCAAPHGRAAWQSLGEYRRCVGRTLDEIVAAGRTSKATARALRRERLEGSCARPR